MTDINTSSNVPRPRSRLRSLMAAIERLEALRLRLQHVTHPRGASRLLKQKRRTRARIRDILVSLRPGALERLAGSGRVAVTLKPDEQILLMALFVARLQEAEPFRSGRDVLWFVADTALELAEASRFLAPGGSLQKAGLVLVYRDPNEDPREVFNLQFAIDTELFLALNHCETDDRDDTAAPFSDAADHFLAFAALIEEFQYRAARAHEAGIWREVYGDPLEPLPVIDGRLSMCIKRFARREQATTGSERFPIIAFRREFGLSEADLVLVVTMLTLRAFAGTTSLEALDLLRLISRDRRELLRHRHLLGPDARLKRLDIIETRPVDGSLGEVALTSWVVERLLDTRIAPQAPIAPDEKIAFHNFLAELQSSDEFYRRL